MLVRSDNGLDCRLQLCPWPCGRPRLWNGIERLPFGMDTEDQLRNRLAFSRTVSDWSHAAGTNSALAIDIKKKTLRLFQKQILGFLFLFYLYHARLSARLLVLFFFYGCQSNTSRYFPTIISFCVCWNVAQLKVLGNYPIKHDVILNTPWYFWYVSAMDQSSPEWLNRD